MNWSHIQEIDRYHRDRTFYSKLIGFRDRDELDKYIKEVKTEHFVYHPQFDKGQQKEDGTWSVNYSCWDSCD